MPVHHIKDQRYVSCAPGVGKREEAAVGRHGPPVSAKAEPLNLPIRRLRGSEFGMTLRLRDDFTFEVGEWGDDGDDPGAVGEAG
jgi:hypothetical protein